MVFLYHFSSFSILLLFFIFFIGIEMIIIFVLTESLASALFVHVARRLQITKFQRLVRVYCIHLLYIV